MIVTSATQTQYTQATNKTTATKATSAYESVTPTTTQQADKMAEMQENTFFSLRLIIKLILHLKNKIEYLLLLNSTI